MKNKNLAFSFIARYNVGMMKITKTENEFLFPHPSDFEMQENTVQSARIGKKDNFLLIVSPRRYKLFNTGMDTVKIVEGNGFFKWKRGETKFTSGDCFEIVEVGEYEINGNGTYIVAKS